MIDLRDILAADALTPTEVGSFADPGSRWVSVDTALLIFERLHPASRSSLDSDSAPGVGGLSSRDEGRAMAAARAAAGDAAGDAAGAAAKSKKGYSAQYDAAYKAARPLMDEAFRETTAELTEAAFDLFTRMIDVPSSVAAAQTAGERPTDAQVPA